MRWKRGWRGLGGDLGTVLLLTAVGCLACDDAAVLLALPADRACARIDSAREALDRLLDRAE